MGREEILDRPASRLDNLADLSRASEVGLRENALVQAQSLPAHTTMFEVVTAQRCLVPRDLGAFIQRIKTLAAVAGEDYYYSFPVRTKNKETGQWEDAPPIEGPSIQLAQDLAREYGNCAIDTRAFDIGEKWVIYARFTDYERGFSHVRPYIQRKGQGSIGTKDRGRQEDLAFQIGVSKAIRNVVVKSLQTFSELMEQEARQGLVANVKARLPHYKERIAKRFKELGVALTRVEPLVGRAIGDWNEFETTRVVMELKSVAENMATPDELWPAPDKFIDPNASPEAGNGPTQGGPAIPQEAGAAAASSSSGGTETPPHDPQTGEIKEEGQAGVDGTAEEPASEKLGMALTELGKLTDFAQINALDQVCAEQLPAEDYDEFAKVKDGKLAHLKYEAGVRIAEAKKAAAKAKR